VTTLGLREAGLADEHWGSRRGHRDLKVGVIPVELAVSRAADVNRPSSLSLLVLPCPGGLISPVGCGAPATHAKEDERADGGSDGGQAANNSTCDLSFVRLAAAAANQGPRSGFRILGCPR